VLTRFRVPLFLIGVTLLLAGCSQTDPAIRTQSYRRNAVYQVEISLNGTNATNCEVAQLPPGAGYGVWLWLELNSDHTGDYTGSDCGHGLGDSGAIADLGDLHWEVDPSDDTQLLITDVKLFGGLAPTTITVPRAYGHYVKDGTEVFGIDTSVLPPQFHNFRPVGRTQLQVAP